MLFKGISVPDALGDPRFICVFFIYSQEGDAKMSTLLDPGMQSLRVGKVSAGQMFSHSV